MLNVDRASHAHAREAGDQAEPYRFTIADMVRVILRRKWMILGSTLVCLALAVAYIATTPKRYSASATLITNPAQTQMLRPDVDIAVPAADPAAIESQLETIKSERVVGAVVDKLNLTQDPEFVGDPPSALARAIAGIRSIFSSGDDAAATPADLRLSAIQALDGALDVRRSGLSYAIDVSVTSLSPEKAALLANAVADAYIDDEVSSSFNALQRSIDWMRTRMSELDTQASDAGLAARNYRTENQLTDSDGRLVLEQQLTQINTQLASAKQESEAAGARLQQAEAAIQSGAQDATLSDALNSQIIVELRQRYLDERSRQDELVRTVGANHQATRRSAQNLQALQDNLNSELRRLQSSYQADYNAAVARQQGAQQRVDAILASLGNSQQAQVRLQELDSRAAALRTLQDSFRQSYLMSIEKQSAPVGKTSVITQASAPRQASSPKTALVLAGGLMLGAGIGAAFALAREFFDHSIRSGADLERATGAEFLGILPIDDIRRGSATSLKQLIANAPLKPSDVNRVFTLPADRLELWTAIRHPFSPTSEALRNIKVSIDVARSASPIHTLGVVSASAGEGKTTAAINLGTGIARDGGRVLVIDGDLRKTQLTRSILPQAKLGLIDLLNGHSSIDEAIWREATTGAYFMPAVINRPLKSSAELLASPAMGKLLGELIGAKAFDYIIIDCSPVLPVVDVRAFSHLVDSFVLVSAWGSTPRESAERVAAADYIQDKLVGAVLTKVELSAYKTFEAYDDSYYYHDEVVKPRRA
ncbi:AAA family ATPase [Aureimonas sp. AU12]|uniref:AAA family ATPase n=1 Tax=Aureimonas sp. AU12 TaxID=1638161 RepID=UPI00078249C4|nr:AAA family ATPase [Aureimonas sp. AU12]